MRLALWDNRTTRRWLRTCSAKEPDAMKDILRDQPIGPTPFRAGVAAAVPLGFASHREDEFLGVAALDIAGSVKVTIELHDEQ